MSLHVLNSVLLVQLLPQKQVFTYWVSKAPMAHAQILSKLYFKKSHTTFLDLTSVLLFKGGIKYLNFYSS